jgi:hypothetical protein
MRSSNATLRVVLDAPDLEPTLEIHRRGSTKRFAAVGPDGKHERMPAGICFHVHHFHFSPLWEWFLRQRFCLTADLRRRRIFVPPIDRRE